MKTDSITVKVAASSNAAIKALFGFATSVSFLALCLTATRAAGLPDTGQDLCVNGSNVLVACTNANTGDAATYPRQDGRFGRDAKATAGRLGKIGAGAAGFDYTKIANNGSVLAADAALGTAATDWACTRDNITGLIWEVKVNNALHLRHMVWRYFWYSGDSSTNGGNPGKDASDNTFPYCQTPNRCDTEKFVADVNATALCGYSDWRMPTVRELRTLVHAGIQNPSTTNPSIDANYFPNTTATPISDNLFTWTSTSLASTPTWAWMVNFVDSITSGHYPPKVNPQRVRLVRGEQF